MSETAKSIRKITNNTFAIVVASPATPQNPNTPATKAIAKKSNAQPNIVC